MHSSHSDFLQTLQLLKWHRSEKSSQFPHRVMPILAISQSAQPGPAAGKGMQACPSRVPWSLQKQLRKRNAFENSSTAMNLATEARSKKSSTALRMRSSGSILERSIVGKGGDFFDFFPRRFGFFGFTIAMTIVIDSRNYLSGVVSGD
jgi:hypothetical protein